MSHLPVLLTEVVRALAIQKDDVIVDGTFGAGGYTRAILEVKKCHVIGLDRDPSVAGFAQAVAEKFPQNFSFYETKFSKMDEVLNGRKVDGVVLDIGVSSMQLDQGERGFSFMRNGPLDMRMSGVGVNAKDAIKYLAHNELIRIFKVYGEEKRARRCADFIVRAREKSLIETTEELANIVSAALGRTGRIHPATRVFQALRIFINDELGELYRALLAAEKILKPGGRFAVVSFHSMEDRIVKNFFRVRSGYMSGRSRHLPPQQVSASLPSFSQKKRSGISVSKEELAVNLRARSARLRVAERTSAPIWPKACETDIDILPGVLSLTELERRAA
ncbi:MAG: 16S rRNA (cytosine(1402)-N(4))-methyltransferase RsmH [Robiginitomaculum sp.]